MRVLLSIASFLSLVMGLHSVDGASTSSSPVRTYESNIVKETLIASNVLATLKTIRSGGGPGEDPNTHPFLGSNCTCESFCKNECAINNTKSKVNVTLYRMTPPDVLDLAEHNTGDSSGDTSFVLSRRTQVRQCEANPQNPFCRAIVIDNTDNVIIEDVVEVDGQVRASSPRTQRTTSNLSYARILPPRRSGDHTCIVTPTTRPIRKDRGIVLRT